MQTGNFKRNKPLGANRRLDTQAATSLVPPPKIISHQSKSSKVMSSDATNQSPISILKQAKTPLHIQQISTILSNLREPLEREYNQLLNNQVKPGRLKQLQQLLATDYFRFRQTTFQSVLGEYANVINACELLLSKLTNNEKLPQKVMISSEQDFVLFFKFFFSKPYTLINMPAVRKVIKLLWDHLLFSSLTLKAILTNLQLWICGISSPLNPSMNKLHRYCSQYSQNVTKLVTHRSNSHVYINPNDSDSLGLTPLMVAAITKNLKAIQKLIKNGADVYICPLTLTDAPVIELVEESKSGKRVIFKKQVGHKERRQPNLLQYLKERKRVTQIAHIFCWQNFYALKKFRKDVELSDRIEMIPDCSFQLQWKEYRGMLCFKQLAGDRITVSKRGFNLRLDFHCVDPFQQTKKKGFYSLILKAEPKQEAKLFMVNHNERFIKNILEDKDIDAIKQRYAVWMKLGNIFQTEVSEIKSIYFPQEERLSTTFSTYYQNQIGKWEPPVFRNQPEYFRAVVESQIISYVRLQKDQMKAILTQNAAKTCKPKAKFVESTCTVDIDWQKEALNLKHLKLILALVTLTFPQSILLSKMSKISQIFQDPLFRGAKFSDKLPLRCKWTSQEVNLQAQIKSLYYCKIDQSVFDLQKRAREMKFQQMEEGVDLSHLQDTVLMEELNSINASRFMGRSELLLAEQDEDAARKFQQLLKLEGIWSGDEQDDK